MPKNVERLTHPITRELVLELTAEQRPLIFSGLFDNQPIRHISTIADLPPEWASMHVRPRMPAERINYPNKNLAETTVAQFLTERAPGFVFSAFPLPGLDAPLTLPRLLVDWGTPTTRLNFYMGNPGAFTHLHFDANCKHNLHYQLIGKKRFFLFPEYRSKYLAPQQQSSRIFLERLSTEERMYFTDYGGGYLCTLEPGETLLIPALMWHYVEYEEPGLSLSFRFASSRYLDQLYDAFGKTPDLHPTVEFQHIAIGLLDDTNVAPDYQEAYQQLLAEASPQYDFLRLQNKMEELCKQLCPEKIECLYANWQDFSRATK